MVRLTGILCFVCLIGAVVFAARPDPWSGAQKKAANDADKFASLIASPDRIGWRMIEDVSLIGVMLWDADGVRQYPPPGGMAPLPYEFSDEAVRDLTSIQARTETVHWAPFDLSGNELLHCRAEPAVCLVYDRVLLEDMLELHAEALTSKSSDRLWALLFAALSCVFGGAWIMLWRGRRNQAPAFKIIPERHTAIRDSLEVSLTPRDLKLLTILEERNGAVVTKDELYDAGWGREYMPNSRALDQHMINLRRKLDPDKSRPVLIETVHGVGYRLVH